MDGLERQLLKGTVAVAGFIAVLSAVGNLTNTADEIAQRRIKDSQSRTAPVQVQTVPPPTPPVATPQAEPETTLIQAKQQADQEQKLLSTQCRFWWQQHEQSPTDRTAQKKAEHCNS